MLNMLSSSDYFFSTISSSMAENSPNLAAFSLAHKSLSLLPSYQGEIYRGKAIARMRNYYDSIITI
jgi:hypothetical protein